MKRKNNVFKELATHKIEKEKIAKVYFMHD